MNRTGPLLLLLLSSFVVRAAAAQCDMDKLPFRFCSPYSPNAEKLIDAVGSVRLLRERVAKAGYRSVVLKEKGSSSSHRVRFDNLGRFTSVTDSGTLHRYAWSDDGQVTSFDEEAITGSADSCRWKGKECRLDASELKTPSRTYPTATGNAWGPRLLDEKGKVFFERDSEGRVTQGSFRKYTYGPRSTRSVDEGETINWTLGADGLPLTLKNEANGQQITFTWARKTAVRVIDGTCPTKKGCKNPEVDKVVAALSADPSLAVSKGDPASKERTATEVWFQNLFEPDAKELVEGPLKPWVPSGGQVSKWEWGGDFDVVVVVGPAPQ